MPKTLAFVGSLTRPANAVSLLEYRSVLCVHTTLTKAVNVLVDDSQVLAMHVENWTGPVEAVEEYEKQMSSKPYSLVKADVGPNNFHFALSWNSFANLHLCLVTPQGTFFSTKSEFTKAATDDQARNELMDRPVKDANASPGRYNVTVGFVSNCAAPKKEMPFAARCRVGSYDITCHGVLGNGKFEDVVCTFAVDEKGAVVDFSTKDATVVDLAQTETDSAAKKPPAKKTTPRKPAAKAARKASVKAAAKKPAAKKAAPKRK